MAITTLDGLIGAVKDACHIWKSASLPTTAQNNWSSYWGATSIPGAGTAAIGNTTDGVIQTNSTTGAAFFVQPTGTDLSYITGATLYSNVTGSLYLYDRAYGIGAFTPTSGTYSGVVGLPINRPSDGSGTEIWVEIVTAIGSTSPTLTITYTNSEGTSNRTATVTIPASASVYRMYQAALQAGDSGVRRITGVSCSASTTGSFNIHILRPLLRAGVLAGVPFRLGIPDAGLRPIYPLSCLSVAFMPASVSSSAVVQVSLDLAIG